MKTRKVKFLVALIVFLFAMLVFGSNKVFANSITYDEAQEILNLVPNEMNLDITEAEYEKAENIVINNIKAIFEENNIDYETTGLEVSNKSNYSMDVFYNVGISVKYYWEGSELNPAGERTTNKTITILFNNTNNRNAADEQSVKDININVPKYIEVDWEIYSKMYGNTDEYYLENMYANYFQQKVSDNDVKVKVAFGEGGGGPIEYGAKVYLLLFKNGILYDIRSVNGGSFGGWINLIPVFYIPSSVKESELSNYVIEKIKENFKKDGHDITRIEKGELGNASIGLGDNAFTVYGNIPSNDDLIFGYILLDFEKNLLNFDEETNIKLDTTTDVVPAGTELKAEEIKGGETYNKIKLSVENVVTKFVLYDITLLSENAKIQPNGKVKISIPIPTNYDTTKLAVFRIEDDGTRVDYEFTVENNYAVIETDHFSNYVIAEKGTTSTQKAEESKTTTEENVNNNDNATTQVTTETRKKDDTPKTGNITGTIIKYVVVCIVIVGIVIIRKNKKRVK